MNPKEYNDNIVRYYTRLLHDEFGRPKANEEKNRESYATLKSIELLFNQYKSSELKGIKGTLGVVLNHPAYETVRRILEIKHPKHPKMPAKKPASIDERVVA